MNLSDFDLDYSFGLVGESLVNDLLTGGKRVEVKRDRKWWTTGNIFVEVECWYNASQSWEASGLTVTKAEYWAFVLAESVLIVPTKLLRLAVEIEGHPISCQIPPNQSRGYLIKPELLLQTNRKNPQS
jgi:hypothetical protein